MDYKTDQEKFWAGDFGNQYTDRNWGEIEVASRKAFFSKILERTNGVKSALELGSNRGINLISLGDLIPDIKMQAVEINKMAADECSKIKNVSVFNGSAFDFPVKDKEYDLTFTRGVLIHIAPDMVDKMYEILYRCSRKYIMIAEYYNPTPMVVTYRGNEDKLFKRDFAGEFMDKYPDVKLIDYGFCYHRDNNFPTDDITWFLMEKG